MQKLVIAFKYLTIWSRFAAIQPSPTAIGSALIYFPLVGLLLGLFLALLNYSLVAYLPPEILSVTLITALIVLTGGIHLEGMLLTFGNAPTKFPATDTPSKAGLGLTAIVMLLLFKTAATDSMDERLTVSLLLAPMLARWALMIFIYGYQERCEEFSQLIAEQLKFRHVAVATAATLALGFYCVGRRALWIGLCLSLFTLFARSLLYRLNVLITRHHFAAMIELAEALSLTLLASL